jgi:hypothetical protein
MPEPTPDAGRDPARNAGFSDWQNAARLPTPSSFPGASSCHSVGGRQDETQADGPGQKATRGATD